MNCHKVQSLVSAYVDGELAGVEMLTVRRHLAECRDCTVEYESLLNLKRAFGRLEPKRPRVDLATRICEGLDQVCQPAHERWLGTLRKHLHPFPARIRVAAAGLAVLAAMLILRVGAPMSPYTSSPEFTISAEALAEDAHIGNIATPVSTMVVVDGPTIIRPVERDPLLAPVVPIRSPRAYTIRNAGFGY